MTERRRSLDTYHCRLGDLLQPEEIDMTTAYPSTVRAARRAAFDAKQAALKAGCDTTAAHEAATRAARRAFQAVELAQVVADAVEAVDRRTAPARVVIWGEQTLAEHRARVARKAKLARGMALTPRG
jgi:hypothetical protein